MTTALLLGARGLSLLAIGELEEAVAVLEEANGLSMGICLFDKTWMRLATAEAARRYAATLNVGSERLDRLRRARSQARRALAAARRFPLCRPAGLREVAWLAAERGHSHRARQLAAQAVQVARELGMAGELDQALALQSRLGAPEPLHDPLPQLTVAQEDRLAQVLAAGTRLARLRSRDDLVAATLENGLSLLRAEQVLWLQDEDVVQAHPVGRATWSKQLLEEALQHGLARQLERPESLSDSLLLSDVRSALAVRVHSEAGVEGVLYFLHRGVASLFGAEDEQVATYLASLSGAVFTNLARRAVSEQARQERAESERRLALLFEQADAAMAVVDADGQLARANQAWERSLGPRTPEQAVVPADRERLRRGESVRYLRREGTVGVASPFQHLLDGHQVLTTLADVSLERVPELLDFLEEERQWLAAELHDGPAQELATACLEGTEPYLTGAFEELTACMSWLAAPQFEDDAALVLAALPVLVQGSATWESAVGTQVYRALQDVLEGCAEALTLHVAARSLRVAGEGFGLADDVRERVEMRCELAGVRVLWQADGAEFTWS